MDPLTAILLAGASLGAAAVAQKMQSPSQRSQSFHEAWADRIEQLQQVHAFHPGALMQALVQADRAQERGELPPGYVWVQHLALPETHVFEHTFLEPVIIEFDEPSSLAVLRDFAERRLRAIFRHVEQGDVIGVRQLSGVVDGVYQNVVLDRPVAVEVMDPIHHRVGEGYEYFDVNDYIEEGSPVVDIQSHVRVRVLFFDDVAAAPSGMLVPGRELVFAGVSVEAMSPEFA